MLAYQAAGALVLEAASAEVFHLAAVGAIHGVTPLAAAGRNGPGRGEILCTGDGWLLYAAFKAPGSATFGPSVLVSTDGNYLLGDGEDAAKWLRVRVDASYLVEGQQASVYLGDLYNNAIAGADVTAAEASAGDELIYTITMHNLGPASLSQLKVWIPEDVDFLEISDDGASWVDPMAEQDALEFPELAAGASDTLHLRRTIPGSKASDPDVLNQLAFSFQGV